MNQLISLFQVFAIYVIIVTLSFYHPTQLNVKRATERRKPDAIMTVSQPFTPHSFNFTKIRKEEILFELARNDDTGELLVNGSGEEQALQDMSNSDKNKVIVE